MENRIVISIAIREFGFLLLKIFSLVRVLVASSIEIENYDVFVLGVNISITNHFTVCILLLGYRKRISCKSVVCVQNVLWIYVFELLIIKTSKHIHVIHDSKIANN